MGVEEIKMLNRFEFYCLLLSAKTRRNFDVVKSVPMTCTPGIDVEGAPFWNYYVASQGVG